MAYASHLPQSAYGAYGLFGIQFAPLLAKVGGQAVTWGAGKLFGGNGGDGCAGAPPPDVVAAAVSNLTGAERTELTALHNRMQSRIGQYRAIPWNDPVQLTALGMGGPEMDCNPGKDEEKAFKAAFLRIIAAASQRGSTQPYLTPYEPPPAGLTAQDLPWWKAVLGAAGDAAKTEILNRMPPDTRARISGALAGSQAGAIAYRAQGVTGAILPLALAGAAAFLLLRR